MGLPITCREAAIAQALVIANTEQQYEIVGYTNGEHVKSVPISPKQRLGDAIATFNRMVVPQGTDCALPILYATKNSIAVDAFVNITDNETWAGKIHPSQALDHYRKRNGEHVRLVVVGMTATNASIARTDDPLSLEVIGYSADVANVIHDFIAGEF
jgi:60 kDa SS-A/Ro ribonucleoprotein